MTLNDKNYWKTFYLSNNNTKCSDFCNFVMSYLKDKNILNVFRLWLW